VPSLRGESVESARVAGFRVHESAGAMHVQIRVHNISTCALLRLSATASRQALRQRYRAAV